MVLLAALAAAEDRRGRIRVICATNTDLQEAVDSGAFREDLFYRIEVVTLRLCSALRDRRNDIPQLCEYLLRKLSRQFRRRIPQSNPVTLRLLKLWDWPGNLRELENWVARLVILGNDEALGAELKRQVDSASKVETRQPNGDRFEGPLVSSSFNGGSECDFAGFAGQQLGQTQDRQRLEDELSGVAG